MVESLLFAEDAERAGRFGRLADGAIEAVSGKAGAGPGGESGSERVGEAGAETVGADDGQEGDEVGDKLVGLGSWSGRRVLDLYAGTGALGIEALSRGAEHADLVDSAAGCGRLMRENLQVTGLGARAQVVIGPAQAVVARTSEHGLGGRYDVVLVDPPYGDPTLEIVLAELGTKQLPRPGGLVVVEHSRRGVPGERYVGLTLIKRRRHGDTEISIYRSD